MGQRTLVLDAFNRALKSRNPSGDLLYESGMRQEEENRGRRVAGVPCISRRGLGAFRPDLEGA